MAEILVIDDEPGIRHTICRLLKAAGHEATAFENGRGAIQYLSHNPVDLLITDIFMPEVEGIETIREIRRTRPDLPIVAMSGSGCGGRDFLDAAEKLGATATLRKPFSRGELLEIVSRLLALA